MSTAKKRPIGCLAFILGDEMLSQVYKIYDIIYNIYVYYIGMDI